MRLLEKHPKETARDYAVRVLRYNIISMDLEPGAMVSENELSQEMGLSRTPVREALIELSKSGIVEIYPQHGSKIAKIDYDKVEEAYFIRKVAEVAVVEEACELAEDVDLRRLEDNLSLHDLYVTRGNSEQIMLTDNDFHRQLFHITKKKTTYELILSIMPHFERVRRLCMAAMPDNRLVEDHRQILDAIKNKDKEQASDLMRNHLTRHQIDKDTIREKFSRYFAD